MNIRILSGEPGEAAALTAAAIIVFLAGLSEGLGTQGVVLMINRITPLRFVINLLLAAVLALISALIWVGALWVATELLFSVRLPLARFFIAVSPAYVPLLLGALTLLPYIGPLIRWVLRLLSFVISLLSIRLTTGLDLWQTTLGAVTGWLIYTLLLTLLSDPVTRAGRWLWALSTGKPQRLGRADLPQVIPGYEPVAPEAIQ